MTRDPSTQNVMLPETAELSRDVLEHRAPKARGLNALVTAAVVLCVFSGIVYVIAQWWVTTAILDALFVSMLIAGTMILAAGLRALRAYVTRTGLDFYAFVLGSTNPESAVAEHTQLCESVINVRRMAIAGLVYGALIGSAPVFLGVWRDALALRVLLVCFLFCVNYATGVGFYALVAFFYRATRMGRLVQVDLWQVDNPSTRFLVGATRRLAVFSSVYICICLSSILFSVLPIGGLVVAYSCFSSVVLIASIVIPALPVTQRLHEAKSRTLRELDSELHHAFRILLDSIKQGEAQPALGKFEALLQLREKVEAVQAWPFRMKSLGAAMSIICFSSIPVVLQIILERNLQ
ncbi:MAG: hypothetical protein AB1601_03770 [Planctomycetota bacterium]